MERYKNRQEAGKILAANLTDYKNHKNAIVLGLPRGGVPIAYEVAVKLSLPLDVFIVRKLGVPGHEELAMGAIAMGEVVVFNEDILQQLTISQSAIQQVIDAESKELARREKAYRGDKPFPLLKGKIIILVDDGIATGATMKAAICALRECKPESIVVAVPVASEATCEEMVSLVDKLICPLKPHNFHAVGAWYQDFSQTEDEEVRACLAKANETQSNA